MFVPNVESQWNENHLQFFAVAGAIIGLALMVCPLRSQPCFAALPSLLSSLLM
jgi:hypothetical protein